MHISYLQFCSLLLFILKIQSDSLYTYFEAENKFDNDSDILLQSNFINPTVNNFDHYIGISSYKVKDSTVKFIFKGKLEYSGLYCKNKNISLNTVFNIGSITKLFLSATIIRLIGDKPSLFPNDVDTKLSFYLPYLKTYYKNSKFIKTLERRPNYENITLRDLMQHTAGIGDFNFPGIGRNNRDKTFTEYEFIDGEVEPVPYGKFSYSNICYNFLGMIMTSITNMKFSKLVKKYILDPLQLKHTFTFDDLVNAKHKVKLANNSENIELAQSYAYYEGKLYHLQKFNFDCTAGGLYSSLQDLTKFVYNFYKDSDSLLFNEKQRKIRDIQAIEVNNDFAYGLGQINWQNGDKGHIGGDLGLLITLRYNKDTNTSRVFILTFEGVTNNLADIILAKGDTSKIPTNKTIDYLLKRVNIVDELRKYYSMDQLVWLNKIADKSQILFYHLHKVNTLTLNSLNRC